MIYIYCDIKDINYLLSDNIDIERVVNIILNLSKKCEYFNRQMFNEKMNELFIIETVIMIKNYKKELLIKNTKLFNILILNIYSLSTETSRTIIRYNNLIIFTEVYQSLFYNKRIIFIQLS